MDIIKIKSELVSKAASQVAQYPQYRNHFDNYVLVQIKRDIRLRKSGLAFTKGELTIARRGFEYPEHGPYTHIPFITAWSMLNGIDTSLRRSDVVYLEQ